MKYFISIVALIILCGNFAFATITKNVGPVTGDFNAHIYCVPGAGCGGSDVKFLGDWFVGEHSVEFMADMDRTLFFDIGLVNKNVLINYTFTVQQTTSVADFLKYELGKQWDEVGGAGNIAYWSGTLTASNTTATATNDNMKYSRDVENLETDTECSHVAHLAVRAISIKSTTAGACSWDVTLSGTVSI